MRCRNLIVGTLFLAVLTACGDPEPVSTGTKAPGLNRASGNQQPATTSTTPGDAAKGQAALTTGCNSCHGKTAHALKKADAALITSAAGKAYHSGAAAVFNSDGDNIKAYLETL